MRSRWLEWTPNTGFVGFEGTGSVDSPIARASNETEAQPSASGRDELISKTGQREPTKPTEPAPLGNAECHSERPSNFWGANRDGKPRDYYGWRAHVALNTICKISGPEGLIIWLDEHSPFLYRRLTSDLPNKISRAWNVRVPHEAFDALCRDLVETFQRAVDLYRK